MAKGTPVIATSVDGVPELVEDEVNGLLVPPGDPDALAHAIMRLASDPELYLRLSKGGLKVAERNTFENQTGRALDIIREELSIRYTSTIDTFEKRALKA